MSRIKILAAAAALAFGASAFAQTGGDDPQHNMGMRLPHGYVPGQVVGQQPNQSHGDRGYQRGGHAYQNQDRSFAHSERDGRYNHDVHQGWRRDESPRYVQRDWSGHRWQRGERLPDEWRSHYYVVDDWRGHHLHRPPAGYHWVQSGSDYLLVAIATGVIASVLLNQ